MSNNQISYVMQTVKGRLITIVSVVALMLSLAFSVAFVSTKYSLEKQVVENAVGLVDVLKFGITDLLSQTEIVLHVLAENQASFATNCSEELTRLMQNTQLKEQYTGLAVLTGKGMLKCSSYAGAEQRLVLDKLDMYQLAVSGKQFSVGKFRLGELSNRNIVPVGLPIESNDGTIHILSAAIKADTFQTMLHKLPLPAYAAAFIIDASGTVIAARHASGEAQWHNKNVAQSFLFKNMTEAQTGGGKGEGLDNVQRLYAFDRLNIDGQEQFLLVTYEEAAVLNRFFGGANSAIAISAGVVTLAGLLLLFAVYFLFIRQVEQLARHGDAIIKGLSWSNEVVPHFTVNARGIHLTEIERVTQCMQLVRDKLDERTDDLHQTQKIARICSWKYRPELATFSFSEGIKEVLPGIAVTNLLSDDFLHYLRAEDRVRLTQMLYALFENKTPFKTVVHFVAEQEFSATQPRYLELHGEPAINSDNVEASFLGTIQDISDAIQLQNELEQSKTFLQAVLDNLDDSVVACDATGALKVFNKMTEVLHGLPVKPIPLTDAPAYYSLYTLDGQRMLQPEDVPLYRAFCGETFGDEYIRIAPELLPYRIVKVRGQPIIDGAGTKMGAIVVQEDMTAILAAESRIKQSEEEFRLVFEATLDGLLVVDVNGNILLANRTIAGLHGYTVEDLLGQNIDLLVRREDRTNISHSAKTTHNNKTFQEKIETIHRTGQLIPVEIATSKISLRGQPANLYVIRDIRERKIVEERLNSLQRMEAVGNLTGGIAHDFNNLLQVILMNLDILEYELEERADLKEMVRSALKAASKGGELTKHLLAFTRQQALKLEQIDIGQLVNSFTRILTSIVGNRQHLVINSAQHPLWVYLDSAQLEVALTQLVMNARDAIEGEGEISITLNQINLALPLALGSDELKAGEYCQIVVQDNGTGMTDETRKRAFEPFFTTKKVGQGSGLGLSMVYGFVQQSGGGIDIISTVGEGTQVILYIPLIAETDANLV